jgi:hypothetical protein
MWQPDDSGRWKEVRSPVDVSLEKKVLRIEGKTTGRNLSRWAIALGLFVAAGGDIRRLDKTTEEQ